MFKDHFSTKAADYAAYRPTYPDALVAYLAVLPVRRKLALDCGCGTCQLIGYVDTWSAMRKMKAALGYEPDERFCKDIAAAWGDPEVRREIRWPLSMRVGRA